MAPHSPRDDSADRVELLDDQLREIYGRVTYSHKAQEKQADILLTRHGLVKLAQIILPAISTAGFLTALLGTGWWGSVVGAGCSAILLALNLYTKDYDLAKQAREHQQAAARLWYAREKYLSLIIDLSNGSETVSNAKAKRDVLVDELQVVYSDAPRTSERAYKKARKSLRFNEEMTFAANEVDAFLPERMRRA